MSLHNIKELYGVRLGAHDGLIGHVKDFYFDDLHWTIRYVVADTGSWLPGRLVLLSPHAFGTLSKTGDALLVNLTRQQIEESPPIASHIPVSRQYEEEYYRFYGWPAYWDGGGIWGVGGSPVMPPPRLVPIVDPGPDRQSTEVDDPHLQSAIAVTGYRIQTPEGPLGHLTDLLIDEKTWAIQHLLVETGHWYAGKEIILSPRHVHRVSFEESAVFVTVTQESIRDAPEYHMPQAAHHDSRNFDA